MKRKPVYDREKRLSRVFPLFSWHYCKNCGYEYKREKMWRWLYKQEMYRSEFMHNYYHYLCKNCAPTKEAVLKILTPPLGP